MRACGWRLPFAGLLGKGHSAGVSPPLAAAQFAAAPHGRSQEWQANTHCFRFITRRSRVAGRGVVTDRKKFGRGDGWRLLPRVSEECQADAKFIRVLLLIM